MKTHTLSSHELSGTDAVDVGNIPNVFDEKLKVKEIWISPNLAVSAHDTNYITLTVKNNGGNTIATKTTQVTGGAAHVEGTPQQMSITATGDDLIIEPGEVISLDVAKAGTGPAYAFQVFAQVELVRVGGD